MNDLTPKLILAIVIVPVLLAIFRGSKEALAITGAITVALFFANIDKFESFKGGGMEAKLRAAVNDAYAAIEQLRELGLAVSSPIVDEMAVSGRMTQYIPLKHKLERVAKIEDTLRKLGAPEKDIEEATSTIYERVTGDHIVRILYSLRASNPAKVAIFAGLDEGKMMNWDKHQLEQFIKDNSLHINNDGTELILDLASWLQNKKLRREEKWQS